MNAKEQKIKEAWAGFYNPQVDMENGWMDVRPGTYSNDQFFDRLKFNSEKHSIRPKKLSGLENNNGWIRIDSESDLPKEFGMYWTIAKFNEVCANTWGMLGKKEFAFDNGEVTHYQLIIKPQPPIY